MVMMAYACALYSNEVSYVCVVYADVVRINETLLVTRKREIWSNLQDVLFLCVSLSSLVQVICYTFLSFLSHDSYLHLPSSFSLQLCPPFLCLCLCLRVPQGWWSVIRYSIKFRPLFRIDSITHRKTTHYQTYSIKLITFQDVVKSYP